MLVKYILQKYRFCILLILLILECKNKALKNLSVELFGKRHARHNKSDIKLILLT